MEIELPLPRVALFDASVTAPPVRLYFHKNFHQLLICIIFAKVSMPQNQNSGHQTSRVLSFNLNYSMLSHHLIYMGGPLPPHYPTVQHTKTNIQNCPQQTNFIQLCIIKESPVYCRIKVMVGCTTVRESLVGYGIEFVLTNINTTEDEVENYDYQHKQME